MSILLSLLLAVEPITWPACNESRTRPDDALVLLGDTLAQRFAPPLSFAPGERFFPTIPFFTALDGDGAMGDVSKTDFEEPWEVAPYLRDKSLNPIDSAHVDWEALLRAYHPDQTVGPAGEPDDALLEFALKRVVVLYRICALTTGQNVNVVRFLKSDEQAFERFEDVQPLNGVFEGKPRFDVIQYFLYYLADKGLQGHPNDVELVSVFFPTERSRWDKFRIVVGSGHSPRTPNNVLVLSAYHRGESRLEDSTYVMVELGGHSSAPDLRPIGRFTPGLDANWHAYNVWGTRDAQAAGGVGYLGKYEQAMTFDRGYGADGNLVFPPRYRPEQMAAEKRQVQGIPDSVLPPPRPSVNPENHQYRLLPMQLLSDLDALLADTTGRLAEISTAVSAIQRRLCPVRRDGFPGCEGLDSVTWNSADFSGLATATRVAAIGAMTRWRNGMIVDTTFGRFEPRDEALPGVPRIVQQLSPTEREVLDPTKHQPWQHQSFRGTCKKNKPCDGKGANPTEVFKSHLFRPNTYTVKMDGGLRNLVLLGMTAAPTDGYEIYTGIVVPAFRSHGLPIRFGGFTEVHVGVNFAWGCRLAWDCRAASPTFGILQEGHRNSIVSWYASANWVPRRPEVTARSNAGEFSLSGGVSLLPKIDANMFRLINVIRIRTGFRFDPLKGEDLLSRVRWELHLAIRQ